MPNPSTLEILFHNQLKKGQLPIAWHEFVFAEGHKWRFDFAWPEKRLAVEIEGGTYTRGRHQRPVGFADDCRKYNHAALLGWRVLRFTGDMVRSGEGVDLVRIALLGKLEPLESVVC